MADLGPLREWGAKSRLLMDPAFTNLLGGAAVGNPNLQRRPPILPTQMLPQSQAQPQAPSVLREPLPMEGRLTFLPAMVTPERGREWALPGVLASAVNAFTAPGRALRGDPVGPDEAMNFAGNVILGGMPAAPTGFGLSGITAWHGSPHKFDRFDMSKIGTGEGAQAYGHGLYMAESPGVAKSYQMAGKPSLEITYKGNEIPRDHILARAISAHDGDLAATEKWLRLQPSDPQIKNALDVIQSRGNLSVNKVEGNLYKVDLPDEQVAKMLDWDKPLSQQPEHIQKALSGIVSPGGVPIKDGMDLSGGGKLRIRESSTGTTQYFLEHGDKQFRLSSDDVINLAGSGQEGKSVYQMLRTQLGSDQAVSQKLREHGIPGIRYLDQGSRQGGKGTSNFVVFSEDIPKIIGRE